MESTRNDAKAGKWPGRCLSILLSVMLVVTMMPLSGLGRAYAQPQTEASAGESPAFVQQAETDGVLITVEAPEGSFPADAALEVSSVTDETLLAKAGEAVSEQRENGTNPALSYTYDIKVLDAEGNELQPAEGKTAEVTFAMAPAADPNLKPAVYHITEATEGEETGELTAEALETGVNEKDETLTVETGGFSLYTVEFTYEDKQYVLKGDESVALDDILKEVGLTGKVETAEVSNEELFSVSEKDGVWTLTSHQAFDTEEWLKVTIGGAEYVITVTDDADDTIQVSSWDELYNACVNAHDNMTATFRLSGDIKRPEDSKNKRIEINKNKKIVIDLNGKTIHANRPKKEDLGKYNHVLDVHKGGDLTIKDSSGNNSGSIKDGYAHNGGGIFISEGGVCRIEGGTIQDNIVTEKGGAIYTEGTLIMTGGSIAYNSGIGESEGRGGAIYCAKSGTMQLQNVKIISNDTDYRGNAIYIVLGNSNSYLKDCTVEKCGIRHSFGKGSIYVDADDKDRVLEITDTEIKNNCTYGAGGGIYLNKGTVEMTGGKIENNTFDLWMSTGGGGVFVSTDQAVFHADSVVINKNGGTNEDGILGGGICNDEGFVSLKNCKVTNNTVSGNGGGIYATRAIGRLTLIDTEVTGNTAAIGGGIYFEDGGVSAMTVGGNTDISENSGSDVYLPGSMLIQISGNNPLGSGANIGVTRPKGPGKFTMYFQRYMGESATPDTYFFSNEGYLVTKQDTEGYLAVDLDEDSKFLKRGERIITNVKSLGPAYWMAGISGERYLNEINIPGTHDTSMNNVSHKGCLSGEFGAAQAKTQKEYLFEQLDHGARFFDIRMKTYYCKDEKSIVPLGIVATGIAACLPIVGPIAAPAVAIATGVAAYNDSKIPVYKDDGVNLWACHGRSAAGTFYAMNDKGEMQKVAEELEWMKTFLRNHPTETIIIDARAETDKTGGDEYKAVMKRFSGVMEELSAEINPSTGESYVYWEDGKIGQKFTHWPQLKDCRGKIVLWGKLELTADTIGGIWMNSDGIQTKKPEGTYKDGDARGKNLKSFIETHNSLQIPKNAMEGQMKEFYWLEMNTTDTAFMQTPVQLAETYVLPVVFGSGRLVNESKKGTYFGWFGIDAGRTSQFRDVWITNFPDDLDYCTITVKSGLYGSDAPVDQVYKVLRGSTITIPGCIYSGAQADKFQGWKTTVNGNTDDKIYITNNTYKVEEDVIFTAQWSNQVQTPVTVLWKDADDLDKLRPNSLSISFNGYDSKTITADGDWTVMLSGDLSGAPEVQNIPQLYTAEVKGKKGKDGYTITMTHTPDVEVEAKGTVTWDDSSNKDGIRPDSVKLHLYANGELKRSGTVTEDENNEWKFDLGTWPRYDENADLIAYKLVEDEISVDEEVYSSGYTSCVEPISGNKNAITGFKVTNIHEVATAVVYARIEWDDDNNAAGKRPESVTVQWMKDGEPYGEPIVVKPEEESDWTVDLELTYAEIKAIGEEQDAIAERYKNGELTEEQFVEALEGIVTYNIKQNGIDYYKTTVTWQEGEGEGDNQTAPYFRILNTYNADPQNYTLTFYEDTEGTKVWKEITLNKGRSLEKYADYGTKEPNILEKEGYTFAGWATEKDINIDSYCDKNGEINPELEEKLVVWSATITEDMNVYPIWIPDRFKVAIEPGSDDVVIDDEQEFRFTANKGEKIAMRNLINAVRDGFELDGWYTEGGKLWNGEDWRTLDYVSEGWNETAGWGVEPKYCDKDEDGETIIRVNDERKYNYYTLTLTARWTAKPVTIKYDLGDHAASGAAVPENGEVTLGNTVTLAEAPKAASEYLFTGWKAPDGTVYSGRGTFFFDDWAAQDDPEAESHSITMTAQFVEKAKVRLIFDADGGTAVDPVTDYEGNSVDLSETRFSTTRAGYDFDGWYNSAGTKCEGKYTFKEDETLTAHWKAKNYTVTFDSTGGSKVSPQTIQWGKTAKKPADPKRSGYEFKGWYADKNLKNAFDFSQKITADTTVYAKWKKTTASGTSGVLFAKMTTKGKKGLKVTWSKVKGAEGYDVFFARCNTAKKVYKYKKVKTLKGNARLSWTKTGLKKGVAYKAYVKAWTKKSGKKAYLKKSPTMHGYTGGYSKRYTNAKSVILKSRKNVTLKVGKTSKIKATVKKLKKNRKLISTKHAPRLRYLSTNKKIAIVTKSGRIKAKGKGACRIYVYAASGVYKQIKVTVK